MIEIDHVAILGMAFDIHYDTGRSGKNWRSGLGQKVDTFVHCRLTGERVGSPAIK